LLFQGGLVRYSLGIDLGTTFVAAALANGTTVEMFTLGDRSVVIPAVVYLRGDGTLATGEAASRWAVSSPDRIGRGFMSRLGDAMPAVLGGAPYDLTAVLSVLLRDMVQKVIETEGEPPDRVALTYPASWGPFRCVLFEEVARQAGLKNPFMVTEPEAAMAYYTASRQLTGGETVAVYDLGGGTFDATVLRQQPGGVQILGKPERIDGLGGVEFDKVILSYVNDAARGALTKGSLDMRHRQSMVTLARLRQDYCTVAKEALSTNIETIFPVFVPGGRVDVPLARSDFEGMVWAPIESTIRALSRTLQSAQVQPADLSAVLLVGGSSCIPLVARMVSAELGCPTVLDTHPQHVVALGAATLAAHAAHPQYDPPRYHGRQHDRQQHEGRHPSRGTTTPTPTAAANTVLGAHPQQRDTQPPIPAQRSADVLPTQRTPRHDAAAAHALAPVAQPRPAQPLPPVDTPLPDNHHAGPEGGRPSPP
jgi:molecular chaperone DnaK